LILNPIVPLMGFAYFSIKFVRYALDSWLPTFLDLQGMNVGEAAYYSTIFDLAGVAGAIIAGIALDSFFRSRWEIVCLIMGVGLVVGYIVVLQYGKNPVVLAVCFGLVGFMLYGPDTLLWCCSCRGCRSSECRVAVGAGQWNREHRSHFAGTDQRESSAGEHAEAAVRNSNLSIIYTLFVAHARFVCG
jgi:sugar phosphate permease